MVVLTKQSCYGKYSNSQILHMAWIVIEVACGAFGVYIVMKKFKLCSLSNLFFVTKLIKFYLFVTTKKIQYQVCFPFPTHSSVERLPKALQIICYKMPRRANFYLVSL